MNTVLVSMRHTFASLNPIFLLVRSVLMTLEIASFLAHASFHDNCSSKFSMHVKYILEKTNRISVCL